MYSFSPDSVGISDIDVPRMVPNMVLAANRRPRLWWPHVEEERKPLQMKQHLWHGFFWK
jgi:hypothetical protein